MTTLEGRARRQAARRSPTRSATSPTTCGPRAAIGRRRPSSSARSRLAEQAVGPVPPRAGGAPHQSRAASTETPTATANRTWRLGPGAARSPRPLRRSTPSERVSLWNNLAELHRLQGDYPEAERLYRVAIEATREAFGEDHPKLATYQNQLGELSARSGRYAEAEPLFGRPSPAGSATWARTTSTWPTRRSASASSSRARAAWPEAEASLRRALAIQEGRLGPRHPEVGTTVLALAEARRPQSRPARTRGAWSTARSRSWRRRPPSRRAQAERLRHCGRRSSSARDAPARARADLARALDILEGLRPEAGGGEHTRARAFAPFVGRVPADGGLAGGGGRRGDRRSTTRRGPGAASSWTSSRPEGWTCASGIEPAERRRLEAREADVQSRLAEYRERLRSLQSGSPWPPGAQAESRRAGAQTAAAAAEFQAVYEEIKNASRFWRASGRRRRRHVEPRTGRRRS